jgi:hypothetical protein
MTKNYIGKGANHNIHEMERFVEHFVEENWGSDRARGGVDYYASRLSVSVVIVDEHGKPDKNLQTPSMKQEMKQAGLDFIKEFERKFGIEMDMDTLSGNSFGLVKWDAVNANTRVAREILQIAKELASLGV